MERNDGEWHVEETWPSSDIEWQLHDVSTWGDMGPVSSSSSIAISASASSSIIDSDASLPMRLFS